MGVWVADVRSGRVVQFSDDYTLQGVGNEFGHDPSATGIGVKQATGDFIIVTMSKSLSALAGFDGDGSKLRPFTVETRPAGLHLLTAHEVMTAELPKLRERTSPRRSKSKTRPANWRTFSELRKWDGFEQEVDDLLASLDDTQRKFQPVVPRTYAAPAQEDEVRARWTDVATIVSEVAESMGVAAEVLGGGSGRSLSCTDYVITLKASAPGPSSKGQAEASAPGPSSKGQAEASAPGPSSKGQAEAWRDEGSAPASKRTRLTAMGSIASTGGAVGAMDAPTEADVWQGRLRPRTAPRALKQTPEQQQQQGQRKQAAKGPVDVSARVIADIEVKGAWQWDPQLGQDLAAAPPCSRKKLWAALYQCYGDMVLDEAAYGAVTNYSCSVFVKSGEDVQRKVLYVSPVMGLERVRLALLLLMRQAYDRRAVKALLRRDDVPSTPEEERQGKQAEAGVGSGASPSAGKSAKRQGQGQGQQDQQAKAGQTRRRPQQQPEAECMGQDEDSCDQLPVYSFAALGITGVAVGHGDYGSVVKASFNGCAAIVKLFHQRFKSAQEAFQHELSMYRTLQRLQGTVVPRLLVFGVLAWTDALFLAVSDEGKDLEELQELQGHKVDASLKEQLVKQALKAIKALHGVGVLHGDVRLANFVTSGDGSVRVVDFGRSQLMVQSGTRKDLDRCMARAELEAVKAMWQ